MVQQQKQYFNVFSKQNSDNDEETYYLVFETAAITLHLKPDTGSAILSGHMPEGAAEQLKDFFRAFFCKFIEPSGLVSILWDMDVSHNMQELIPFFRYCVHAVLEPPKKHNTYKKRIANAVQLMNEAETQGNDSIGITLLVAALEAMLGRKATEIAKQLQENVAVLLEPEREHRG